MIGIDRQSRVPVYEQIKNQIMTLIRLNVYPAHAKLPSIRQISADTGINVNTVKKSFSELEMNGVIYSVPGTGSFVSENALSGNNLRETALREVRQAIDGAKSCGISKNDISDLLNTIYEEDELND